MLDIAMKNKRLTSEYLIQIQRDTQTEFVFKSHDELNGIKTIQTKTLDEMR